MTDFITYASINLTWFAFNFVLCALPLVCILLQSDSANLIFEGKTASYAPIVYTLFGMHLLHFVCKMKIYKIEKVKGGDVTEAGDLSSQFDKDD